ncbi:MAG TPA: glycosyltransferase family 39 protein [Alphaproteobacteria bacterium]|nr:glycosyltransferase family 39 protein [Alphaproteobacteria bacterium]
MATPPDQHELPLWLRPPAIAIFVLLMLAVRFVVAGATGLVRDEGYYTLWSFWPAPGYLDHPPMLAWLIAAGRVLAGESELGVRLFPILATAAISFAIYRTGRLLLDARTAGIAVIWFNLTVASGLLFIAAPDAPSVSFWALAIWAVAEFVARRNPAWWLAAGLFAGLGLLSKYTTVLLGAGLLLFLLSSRERIGWLKLWQVWAGAAVAVGVFLPNLIWNAEHGWAGFGFQARRMSDYGLSFGSFSDNLLDFVGGQAAATGLFLFILVGIGAALFFSRRDLPGRANLALPLLTALPLLITFTAYNVKFRVEANWPVAVWPMLSLVGAWAAVHARPRHLMLAAPLAVLRWAQAPVGAMLLALIYAQALWQPFALGQAIDRTRDMRGWRQVQADVAALATANGAQWVAVIADYGLVGELAAYARFNGDTRPVEAMGEFERYDFRPPFDAALLGKPAVFVADAGASVDVPLTYFAEATALGTVERRQPGEVLQRFEVFLVARPLPATANALLQR